MIIKGLKKISITIILIAVSLIFFGCQTNYYEVSLPSGYELVDESKNLDIFNIKSGTVIAFKLPTLDDNQEYKVTEGNKLIRPDENGIYRYQVLKNLEIKAEIILTVDHDQVPPVITIEDGYEVVRIYVGDEIDLLDGVSGYDNIDGIITNRIIIIDNNFRNDVVGEYEIHYYLSDSSNNVAEVRVKRVVVMAKPIVSVLDPYPIFGGQIPNEPAPSTQSCFPGAYYHKVQSTYYKWYGLEATVTLPMFKINRYRDGSNSTLPSDPYKINEDNPSIYMGGNFGYESDIGLSLSLVQLKNGGISTGSVAFRPFWRYITNVDKDEGSYDLENNRLYAVSCTGNNCFGNYHPSKTEHYYLPGDKLRIIVYSPAPNKLMMQVEVLAKSTLPYSVQLRADNDWNDPENFISPIFSSPGVGLNRGRYKRVNAIDQKGNEGKPAIDTTTYVEEAIWESTYLHYQVDNKFYRVAMNASRTNKISCPSTASPYIEVTEIDEKGGQSVAIRLDKK